MAMDPLVDGHGRRIGDLRVSVTDRCNFRCQYCMPAEGLPWLERDDGPALRGDRAARRRCWPRWASRDVRLTGGEPLVRRDFPALVGHAAPRSSRTSAITTNGYLLERDAEALVRAGVDALQRLDRLAAARPLLRDDPPRRAAARAARPRGARRASPRRTRSRSTPSPCAASPRTRCCPFARFAREHPYEVRFIEFMPLDADHAWTPDSVLTGDEIRAIIERALAARADAARAARHRARLPLRRRHGLDRLHQPGVASRSAATATASA